MKERIYISGTISGTNDFMERFAKAEKELAEWGYSVLNPAKLNLIMPSDTTWEEYMQMSMTMLKMCDCIYMLRGWASSKGANREYAFAVTSGMQIIFEEVVE